MFPEAPSSVGAGLRALHRDAENAGELFAFVSQVETEEAWNDGLLEFLTDTSATVAVVSRNSLDHLICATRDCFTGSTQGSSAVVVDQKGNEKECTFRREKNWKFWIHENPTQDSQDYVHFQNKTKLLSYLENDSPEKNIENNLNQHQAYFNVSLTSEDLALFEYDPNLGEDSPMTTISLTAWQSLLTTADLQLHNTQILNAMRLWMDSDLPRRMEPYDNRIYQINDVLDVVNTFGYDPLNRPFANSTNDASPVLWP